MLRIYLAGNVVLLLAGVAKAHKYFFIRLQQISRKKRASIQENFWISTTSDDFLLFGRRVAVRQRIFLKLFFIMKISSICKFLGFAFAASALILPRAYGPQKLILLIALLAVLAIPSFAQKNAQATRPLPFFLAYATIFSFALVVGLLRGNSYEALLDGFRLGILFPLIIAFLWIFLSEYRYEIFLDRVVVFSAFVVSSLVFVAFFQNVFGLQILPESFAEENLLRVGLHDGYSQVVAHNIGSLFFIFGYLICSVAVREKKQKQSVHVIALVFVLLAAMISGRRALQFAMLASPAFIFLTSLLFKDTRGTKIRVLKWWIILLVLMSALLIYLFANGYFYFDGFVERFSGVFEDDGGARTSQASSLFSGFANHPFFGSGIGGVVDIVRSESAPWVFELTYLQILFNFGILGSAALFFLFLFEFGKIRSISSQNKNAYLPADKAVITGVLFLFFGAASNPYLGSFDFLLMIGAVPFVASIGSSRRATRVH